MAQVISATAVKIKFPEFVDKPDTQIEMAIEEAALEVDSTWDKTSEGGPNYQIVGMLYMTAHILAVQTAMAASGTGQRIASESFAGVVSVTYQTDPTPGDVSIKDLSSTAYGLRVQDFMSRLFPAVMVI